VLQVQKEEEGKRVECQQEAEVEAVEEPYLNLVREVLQFHHQLVKNLLLEEHQKCLQVVVLQLLLQKYQLLQLSNKN
jgi:hypothetical protein